MVGFSSNTSSNTTNGHILHNLQKNIHNRRKHGISSSKFCNTQRLILLCMSGLGFIYVKVSLRILTPTSNTNINVDNQQQNQQQRPPDSPRRSNKKADKLTLTNYYDWKKYAVHLAGLTPSEIVQILKEDDPFGVRTFEKRLQETESEKGRFLSLQEFQELFPCPSNSTRASTASERITLPDLRDHNKAELFRTHPDYFLFFQHLRKAGGTNFCALAEANFKRKQLPEYYCMPDYHWNTKQGERGAGYLTRYTNTEINAQMKHNGHKIAGNEWDPFAPDRFFYLKASTATSFRKPLDRALSQFRFECMEDRGCKIKNVTKWWDKRRRGLTNVYTWTFSGEGVRKISISQEEKDVVRRKDVFGKALDTVATFNLVMVMEWLAYAPAHVTEVLGFTNTEKLTERVRPHINQRTRDDGQERNNMGSAGIAKASWTPEKYLPPALYERMSHDLALDEILTDAARRMFLERIVCYDVHEPTTNRT